MPAGSLTFDGTYEAHMLWNVGWTEETLKPKNSSEILVIEL